MNPWRRCGVLARHFSGKGISPSQNYAAFTLQESWTVATDSKVLRFALADGQRLNVPAPSGVKVKAMTDPEGLVSKSYSPISHPDSVGYYDLLVKHYAYPEGALSRYLCNLQPGDQADIWIKPKKDMSYGRNRWKSVGFVAGGTGLAPCLQIIRTALSDQEDDTHLQLIYSNRTEDSILMREELDQLSQEHADRFQIYYTLSQPPEDWAFGKGWVSAEMVTEHLPAPSDETKIFICGTDQFLQTVCGMKGKKENGKKPQGPTTGLLGDAGYRPSMVFKL